MNDADYIERTAQHYESIERKSRSQGMFCLAVCYQQLAAWVRDRSPINHFSGMGALSLLIHVSDDRGVAMGTIPHELFHDAARFLEHVAELNGFPKPLSGEELEEQQQELAARVQSLAEAIAALRLEQPDGSL